MPTHEELEQFLREYVKLTVHQQTLFLTAVRSWWKIYDGIKGFGRA